MVSYFSARQLLPLFPAVVFLFTAILLFEYKKDKSSLALLFLGTAMLGCFIALLDPFIILWDEQYHALVAKNMMSHPLKPMLYADPVMGYDHRDWTNNHVWLHKQPLFLWQLALSLKIFGINTFALRLPSVLLHALIPLMIYRIGKIILDRRTGFYGALFFAVAYFPLELVAARYSTDHNDVAFIFYVTASLWSWFEYHASGKKFWIVLAGLFSGCAILVKWLVGLLVYLPWGISILADTAKRRSLSSYRDIAISILVCLAVFLPWQVYIFLTFPREASYELTMNTRHLFEAIEGHAGNTWYHFLSLRKIYGQGQAVPFLLLAGLIVLFFKVKNRLNRIGLFLPIIAIYLFYSLAATKMLSFPLIVSPMVFLGMAALMTALVDLINKLVKNHKALSVITVSLAAGIAFFNLDLSRIQGYHTFWKPHDNCNRQAELFEMKGVKAAEETLPASDYVIFNASMRVNGHIPIMFFTNHIAYNYIPTLEQLALLKSHGYKAAVFDLGDLPEYLRSDTTVKKIEISR